MNLKKGLTFAIILLLIGLGIAIIIGSNQGRDVFFIQKFNKTVQNTIVSKPNKKYNYQIVRLKGEVDDTIKVKPCDSCDFEKLSGKISIKYKYGFKGGASRFELVPYKAKSGKLKIVHKIR